MSGSTNSPKNHTLAEPFAQIFEDRAEAEWAFDLMKETVTRLKVRNPYDRRLAINLIQQPEKTALHLNFGGWLVLGFRGSGSYRVGISLLEMPGFQNARWIEFPFVQKEEGVRTYQLPMRIVRPLTSDLQTVYELTLSWIAVKFQDWERAATWKQHRPEIVEALFDRERQERLFAGLLVETELLYERQRTAFYQDISEEQAVYTTQDETMTYDVTQSDSEKRHYFSQETFEILAGLHQSPNKKEYYKSHREKFKSYLETPFQELFQKVAARLPTPITIMMETETRILARMPRETNNQERDWNFYWGAFYPKGRNRAKSAQLAIWINHERLEFGFHIGEQGQTHQERFLRNCQTYYETLADLLEDILSAQQILYGPAENFTVTPEGDKVVSKSDIFWKDWLKNPSTGKFDVEIILPRQEVLRASAEQLIDQIVHTFIQMYPLVQLATLDTPLPAIKSYLDVSGADLPTPTFSSTRVKMDPIEQLSTEIGIEKAKVHRWLRAIERKKQVMIYGPPGTGKTYTAMKLAQHLTGQEIQRVGIEDGEGFWELLQFHSAYAYEDFVEGIRPFTQKGQLNYELKAGRFLEFCQQAAKQRDTCVLIIDEINRANLARVFGELMYLLEYRSQRIRLSSGTSFKIPGNVRLIGTMNTADRSIALVDHALRRRFAFLALSPNYDLLQSYHQQKNPYFSVEILIDLLKALNKQIGDQDYVVGITFFLHEKISEHLTDIWQMEIEPYLEEYFFDQPEKINAFRWERIKKDFRPTQH